MKYYRSLFILMALAALGRAQPPASAAEEGGVALAIIYDTSGSMRDPVPDRSGKGTPKYVIANRALIDISKQLQAFAEKGSSGTPRQVQVALFTFKGNGAREAIPFGPFDPAAFQKWAAEFSSPSGNTPLGSSLLSATARVLKSPLPHKHVLVITDGMNTVGPQPSTVLSRLQRRGEKGQVMVHFVAFDVAASVFDPVKKLGATVVSASDEKQLDEQLDFILQRKILLEDEEPPRPANTHQ